MDSDTSCNDRFSNFRSAQEGPESPKWRRKGAPTLSHAFRHQRHGLGPMPAENLASDTSCPGPGPGASGGPDWSGEARAEAPILGRSERTRFLASTASLRRRVIPHITSRRVR